MKVAWRVALGGILALAWGLLATLQGRLLVTCVVLLAAAIWPPLVEAQRRRARRVLLGVVGICVLGIALLMPARRAALDARVQAVFVDSRGNQVAMPWLPYLGNLVPESDLIRVATLGKGVFPFPTGGALLEELRAMPAWDSVFVREYRDFRRAGLDRRVPSVLFLQLLQQLGYYAGITHFVLLLPPNPTGKTPVLIFLHGYMGNFQLYSSWLHPLGDVAIVLPSTRSLEGHWQKPDLERLFDVALPALEARTPIDRTRLHLVGLSNGGSGVNRALRSQSSAFASFTFLSTWVDAVPPGVSHQRPLRLIYGERDSIAANNRSMAASLRERGFNVRAHAFPGERHFVMLTRRDEIRAILRAAVVRE